MDEENINKEEGNAEKAKTDPVAELTKKVEAMEENWKKEQRNSSKKDLKIQELEAVLKNRESDQDLMKAFVATIAQSQGKSPGDLEEEITVKQPDLLQQYEHISKAEKTRREQEAYNQRANAIWTEVAGLPDGDENKEYVEGMLFAGKFDRAQTRVDKLKEVPEKPAEPPKPTEEEIAEAARKKLEEDGQLANDLPLPRGSGDIITPEYVAQLKANAHTPAGLKALRDAQPAIEKATMEGKLK